MIRFWSLRGRLLRSIPKILEKQGLKNFQKKNKNKKPRRRLQGMASERRWSCLSSAFLLLLLLLLNVVVDSKTLKRDGNIIAAFFLFFSICFVHFQFSPFSFRMIKSLVFFISTRSDDCSFRADAVGFSFFRILGVTSFFLENIGCF